MYGKTASLILLSLLIISALAFTYKIRPAWASGTIYIMADGSIDPPSAPIATVDNVTYTLIGSITTDSHGIVIYRDSIVVDGVDFAVTGSGSDYGIYLLGRTNVTLRNMAISNFLFGIYLISSSKIILSGNIITANVIGVRLDKSSQNIMSGNDITNNNDDGILIFLSSYNILSGNNIKADNVYSIELDDAYYNNLSSNIAANNHGGISFTNSSYNTLSGNEITGNNEYGVILWPSVPPSENNRFYHNDFVHNLASQVAVGSGPNIWDDGYPSGGNYWNDYTGVDANQDGIGDTPYYLDGEQDTYPLMNPYAAIGVTNVTTSKTVVTQGYNQTVTVSVDLLNYGFNAETLNLTTYANSTVIGTITNIGLAGRNSTIVTFAWNTTDLTKGNYTISAYALPVPGETYTADNNFTDCWVKIAIVGDVNGDGKVNLIDVFAVALAYGSYPGHPKWNPNYDINNDGKINLIDYFTTALNYGKTDS